MTTTVCWPERITVTTLKKNAKQNRGERAAARILSRCHDNHIVLFYTQVEKKVLDAISQRDGIIRRRRRRLEFEQVRLDGIHPTDWPSPTPMRMEKRSSEALTSVCLSETPGGRLLIVIVSNHIRHERKKKKTTAGGILFPITKKKLSHQNGQQSEPEKSPNK